MTPSAESGEVVKFDEVGGVGNCSKKQSKPSFGGVAGGRDRNGSISV